MLVTGTSIAPTFAKANLTSTLPKVKTEQLLAQQAPTSAPAQFPESSTYLKLCAHGSLATQDGTQASTGEVGVYVNWEYSGGLVRPHPVLIYNLTGRSITTNYFRWQNAAGTQVQRGPSGEIANGRYTTPWYPTWIPQTENPSVRVSVYATTRPAAGFTAQCRP